MPVSAPALPFTSTSFSGDRTSMQPASRCAVRKSWQNESEIWVNSPKDLVERIIAFCSRRYGHQKVIDRVSHDLGFSRSRVAKWFERTCAPDAFAIVRMIQVYGASFLAILVPTDWATDAAATEQRRVLEESYVAALAAREAFGAARQDVAP